MYAFQITDCKHRKHIRTEPKKEKEIIIYILCAQIMSIKLNPVGCMHYIYQWINLKIVQTIKLCNRKKNKKLEKSKYRSYVF